MSKTQLRVSIESAELLIKIKDLSTFKNSITFESLSETHKRLLIEQLFHMKEYSDVLILRLSEWGYER